MKTRIYLLGFIILLCVSCHNKAETKGEQTKTDSEQGAGSIPLSDDSLASTIESVIRFDTKWVYDPLESPIKPRSLNDIRFEKWTRQDWYENDYYRFLRICINDCLKGVINEDTAYLQHFKSALKRNNQFFLFDVEEFIVGGLLITFGFLNEPEVMYQTVVYSCIDEKTEKIRSYELHAFGIMEEASDFTREELWDIHKEHPEKKIW